MPLSREEVVRLADIYHIQLSEEEIALLQDQMAVSYTHLTLPTIYSV